ncbi:hypothetical protein ABTD83_20790, partial [Acinetobacter baumannii]
MNHAGASTARAQAAGVLAAGLIDSERFPWARTCRREWRARIVRAVPQTRSARLLEHHRLLDHDVLERHVLMEAG